MDIMDSLARIRIAFLSINLKPPTAIFLESHEEGMRFLDAIRQTDQLVYRVGGPSLGLATEMADGSIWMSVEVMGIAVRWPANRIAMPDGSWQHA